MDTTKPRKPSPFQLEIGNVSARIKQLHQSTERMLELNQQKNKFIADNLRSNKYTSNLPGFAISLIEESICGESSQNAQQPKDKQQQIVPQRSCNRSNTDRSPVSLENKNFSQYKILTAPNTRAISPQKKVKQNEKRSVSPISKTMISRLGTKSPLQQTSFSKFSTVKVQQSIPKQQTQGNIPKKTSSLSTKEDAGISLKREKVPQKFIAGENPYLSRFLNCLNKCEDNTKDISYEESSPKQRREGMERCFSFGQQQEEGKIAKIMEKEEETDVVQTHEQFFSVEKKNQKRVQFCNTVTHCFTPNGSSSSTNNNTTATTPLNFTRFFPLKNTQSAVQNQTTLQPHPIIKNIPREQKSISLQNTLENQGKMSSITSISQEKSIQNIEEFGLNTIALVMKNAEDARVNEINLKQKKQQEIKSGFIDLNRKQQESHENDTVNTNKFEVDGLSHNKDSEKQTDEGLKQPHKTLLEMRQKLVKGCGQGENCFDGGLADFINKTSTIKRTSSQEFLDCKHRSSELIIADKIQAQNKETSKIQNIQSNQDEQQNFTAENTIQTNDSVQLLLPSTEPSSKQINHLYEQHSSIKVKNWRLESPSSSNASSSVATTNSAHNSTGGLLDLKQQPFIIDNSEQRLDQLAYQYQQSQLKAALTRIDLGTIPKEMASQSNLFYGFQQQSKQIQRSNQNNILNTTNTPEVIKNDNNSISNPQGVVTKNTTSIYQIPSGFQSNIDSFSRHFDGPNNLSEELQFNTKTIYPKLSNIAATIDNSSLSRYNNTSPNNCCSQLSPKQSASSLCFPLSATNRSSKQYPNRLSFASLSSKFSELLPQSTNNCQNTSTEKTNPYFSAQQKSEKKDEKSIKPSTILITKINNINWEI